MNDKDADFVLVIPAKAGISALSAIPWDPRFRGDDKKEAWMTERKNGMTEIILIFDI